MSILAKLCLTPLESHQALLQTHLEQHPEEDEFARNLIQNMYETGEHVLRMQVILSQPAYLKSATEASWIRLALICDNEPNKELLENLYSAANRLLLNTQAPESARLNAYYFLRSQNQTINYFLSEKHILNMILSSSNPEAWAALLSDQNAPTTILHDALHAKTVSIERLREFAIPLLGWLTTNIKSTTTQTILSHFANLNDSDVYLSLIAQSMQANGKLEILRNFFEPMADMNGDDLFSLFFMKQKLSTTSTQESGEEIIQQAFKSLESLKEEGKTEELFNLFIIPALQANPRYFIHVLENYSETSDAFKELPQVKAFMQLKHFFYPDSTPAGIQSDITIKYHTDVLFNLLQREYYLEEINTITQTLSYKIDHHNNLKSVQNKKEKTIEAVRTELTDTSELLAKFNDLKTKVGAHQKNEENNQSTYKKLCALHDKIKEELSEEQLVELNKNIAFAKSSLTYRVLKDIEASNNSTFRKIGRIFAGDKPIGKDIKIPFLIWILNHLDELNSEKQHQRDSVNSNVSAPLLWEVYVDWQVSLGKTCHSSYEANQSEFNDWLNLVLSGTTTTKTADTIKKLPLNIRIALFTGTEWEAKMTASNSPNPKKESVFSATTVFGSTQPSTDTSEKFASMSITKTST